MRFVLSILIVLFSLGAAHADEAARNDLAKVLVEKTSSNAMVDQMAEAVWPTLEATITQANDEVGDELLGKMKAVYVDLNRDLVNSMSGDIVQFYAANFTEEELQQLLDFYESDLGVKTLAMTPKLMSEVMPGMMAKIQQDIPKMIEEFKVLLEEEGLKFE